SCSATSSISSSTSSRRACSRRGRRHWPGTITPSRVSASKGLSYEDSLSEPKTADSETVLHGALHRAPGRSRQACPPVLHVRRQPGQPERRVVDRHPEQQALDRSAAANHPGGNAEGM